MVDGVAFGSNEQTIIWGEIAPGQHIAQFYADDRALLETLTGFVGAGLNAEESAIIIATPEHLRALRYELVGANVDLARAMLEDRYIPLDASVALTSFMVNDWPDEKLFTEFIGNLFRRASVNNQRVRAFGEMVALLWARGHAAATVNLENLWGRFCQGHSLSLLCAYPKAGFTEDSSQSLAKICAAHSKIM